MPARPIHGIEADKLKALMRMNPTLEDTAAFFDCSYKTIQRFIHDEFGCTFVQFREKNMVHTRLMLVRTALKKAESGDKTMLIFCLKNLCGWADRSEVIQKQDDLEEQVAEKLEFGVKRND